MYFVKAATLGECWADSVNQVMTHGEEQFDEDVALKELLGLSIHVERPSIHDDFIARYGDNQVIEKMLKKFSKGVIMSDRPFTYGQLIYDNGGIDQFEWLIERIFAKPASKSATVSLLTAGSKSLNLPCLTTLDAKLRNGELHLQFFFRSQNVLGRQYANLLALAQLHQKLSERCGCAIGTMKGHIASAHIYSYDYTDAIRLARGADFKIADRFYSHGPRSIRQAFS